MSAGGARVLIVEDDPDIVDYLGLFLEDEGYEVEGVGTCAEAVARAREAECTSVIDFRVEAEDSVYPMVPAGAALENMSPVQVKIPPQPQLPRLPGQRHRSSDSRPGSARHRRPR